MTCQNCAYLDIDRARHEKGRGKCLLRSYKFHQEPFEFMVTFAKDTCDRLLAKPKPAPAVDVEAA
jgi:hypothetical protein